jgi:hypothetical protein
MILKPKRLLTLMKFHILEDNQSMYSGKGRKKDSVSIAILFSANTFSQPTHNCQFANILTPT